MLGIIIGSILLTFCILLGPAWAVVYWTTYWYHPKDDDPLYKNKAGVAASTKLLFNKAAAVMAILASTLVQDLTASSILVYSLAAAPWTAMLDVFGCRQTCAWLTCITGQVAGSAFFERLSGWVELSPVLDAAVALFPVDCYDAEGNLTHEHNEKVFLTSAGVVVDVVVLGCVFNPAIKECLTDLYEARCKR
eukprot:TRINITY_DN3906_c0_g1_i3.p1 TRINITY_DN3906_c0_g1~~TRINITY_DN3906_c0_g1_i3.p1  ORF type:complete len:192 (+),score=60.14 TRINITY_DN3906_c0_g1_i3:427-1002(+)